MPGWVGDKFVPPQLNAVPDEDRPAPAPVNVPLPVQEKLLAAIARDGQDALRGFLHRYWDEVEALAWERLREGYEMYGSEMFTWAQDRRHLNVLEELADALVYMASGDY